MNIYKTEKYGDYERTISVEFDSGNETDVMLALEMLSDDDDDNDDDENETNDVNIKEFIEFLNQFGQK